MSVVFPVEITQHLMVQSYTEKPPNVVIRTQNEQGPDKVRRRTTANVRPMGGTLSVTRAQLEIFDEWFNDTLLGGAEEFEWTNVRTDATKLYRITTIPEYRSLSSRDDEDTDAWEISFGLEEMPLPVLVGGPGPGEGTPPGIQEILLWGGIPAPEEEGAEEESLGPVQPFGEEEQIVTPGIDEYVIYAQQGETVEEELGGLSDILFLPGDAAYATEAWAGLPVREVDV